MIAAAGATALVIVSGAFAASTVFAQAPTPATPETTPPSTQQGALPGGPKLGRGFGFMGGSTAQFDAAAKALNLTPTQLFEQLHSGKTLEEIATAQGVELQTVMDAINTDRIQAMKDEIAQAVTAGTITQEQADWMLQGIENGYLPGRGPGGFGEFGDHDRGHGHGRGGLPGRAPDAPTTPTTPAPDDTSSST